MMGAAHSADSAWTSVPRDSYKTLKTGSAPGELATFGGTSLCLHVECACHRPLCCAQLAVIGGLRSTLLESSQRSTLGPSSRRLWGSWEVSELHRTKRFGELGGICVGSPHQVTLSVANTCSTGRTGHVEVLQVAYDPSKVEYEELVRFFYTFHVSISVSVVSRHQTSLSTIPPPGPHDCEQAGERPRDSIRERYLHAHSQAGRGRYPCHCSTSGPSHRRQDPKVCDSRCNDCHTPSCGVLRGARRAPALPRGEPSGIL